MSAIRTERLSKRYGSTLALDALDLTVQEGEVYGYLGPKVGEEGDERIRRVRRHRCQHAQMPTRTER